MGGTGETRDTDTGAGGARRGEPAEEAPGRAMYVALVSGEPEPPGCLHEVPATPLPFSYELPRLNCEQA